MFNSNRHFITGLRVIIIILVLLTSLVLPSVAFAQTGEPPTTATGPVFLSAFLENLLLAFAPVIAALVAGFLVAQIKLVLAKIKAARPDVYDQMIWVVSTAVKAAEQAGIGKLGTEKKQYALDYVQKWLTEKGLKIDVGLISSAIEAAVYEEINRPGLAGNQPSPLRSLPLFPDVK